ASALVGRVAEIDTRVAGFTVSVLHDSSWTRSPICYLEDLFVDPALRGAGVGRALIQDLIDLGRMRGWSQLYWVTRANNEAARRLYDKFALADNFVRYRLTL
ncbi:MAG: N-acetyltransferase family protein, partial [Methylocystis sp.]